MSSNNSDSADKKSHEKSNVIAIYAFAIGVFILVILSSAGFFIKLEWMQLVGLGFVTVLLLFRYFDLIKLGGILELSRKVSNIHTEQKQFMSSTADEVLALKRKSPKKEDVPKSDEGEPEEPSEIQVAKCLELLRDPEWDYRTEKSLMQGSNTTRKQFDNFLASNPEVILSKKNDIYGNKLYRLIR